jgi:Cu(I)/Ag(I) efflux system membrane fusion protein
MKRSLVFIWIGGLLLFACKGKNGAEHSGHEHAHHAMAAPAATNENNTLTLTNSEIELANITTERVSQHTISQTRIVNARLHVNQDNSSVISSRIAGRIERLFMKETGRAVKQGEPLYEIYSETLLTLQREYLLAIEQNEVLGKEEKKYQTILAASEAKLLLYGLNKNQISQLGQMKVMQPRTTFLSPTSGIVSEIEAAEGQYVNEGSRLYRIENLSSLWIEAELYSSEVRYAKLGSKISVRVSGFESEDISATINFLSPEFKANTQITTMRAILSNPGLRFKPGMQAQVFLAHSARQALTIPTDAVIRDGMGAHVYVLTNENAFEPRMIKIGVEDSNQVEIVSGLEENEIVAVTGAYLLYSEWILNKGSSPMGGHSH